MIAIQNRTLDGRETNSLKANVYDDGLLRVEYDSYYVTLRGEMVRIQRAEFFGCLPSCTKEREICFSRGIMGLHLGNAEKI